MKFGILFGASLIFAWSCDALITRNLHRYNIQPRHHRSSTRDVYALSIKAIQPMQLSSFNNLVEAAEEISLNTDISDFSFPLTSGVLSIIGVYGLLKLFIYWSMQLKTAELLSGIPPNLSVVEVGAVDGKNIFYLPKGSDYLAVMPLVGDENKQKEKAKLDEQLILECIGKANREGAQLKGRVRSETTSIPSQTVDCIISTGALGRAGASARNILKESYRILKPGGLYVFVEPDPYGSLLMQYKQVFPEYIKPKPIKSPESDLRAVVRNEMKSTKAKRSRGKSSQIDDELSSIEIFAAEAETSDQSIVQETKVQEADIPVKSKNGNVKKPGLVYEKIDNFNLDPYISGVAVKPY